MKKITVQGLDKMAINMPEISKDEQQLFVGGTRVVTNVNRTGYGTSSTLSSFLASYNVEHGSYHHDPSYYEVTGVEGRSGIFIHNGNSGDDTTGCFLPGTSSIYDSETDNYSISDSNSKRKELTDFLDKYGLESVQIMCVAYKHFCDGIYLGYPNYSHKASIPWKTPAWTRNSNTL